MQFELYIDNQRATLGSNFDFQNSKLIALFENFEHLHNLRIFLHNFSCPTY